MFIWIVEEQVEDSGGRWVWEFKDAGVTETDADKIIDIASEGHSSFKNFYRKKMVLVKDFSKMQVAN